MNNEELIFDKDGQCIQDNRKYFDNFSVQPLLNKNVHVTKHRDTDEKIIICRVKN